MGHAWAKRANLYAQQGQWEKAKSDYYESFKWEQESTQAGNQARNSLAWLLATCPDVKVRGPIVAVGLAKQAVQGTQTWATPWNILGVAHYRAGDWKAAVTALEHSMQLHQGGDGVDWFFLAMAHSKMDHEEQARKWYDQAVQWMDKNKPQDEELRRFRAEAAELLGIKD